MTNMYSYKTYLAVFCSTYHQHGLIIHNMPGMWLFPVTSLLGGWYVGLLIGGVHLLCQTMWSQRPHKVLGPHGGHGGCHADQVG